MKCLVCGTLVPTEYEMDLPELSNAGNRFLSNFLREYMKGHDVEILSYIGTSISDEVREKLINEDNALKVAYFFRDGGILAAALRFHRSVSAQLNYLDCVVCYNPVYAWLFSPYIARIKKKKSILLLADYSPVSSYSGFARKLYAWVQKLTISRYDYVVGLSENTRKYVGKGQHFLCIEGGIDGSFYNYFQTSKEYNSQRKILMYSGTLEPLTGVTMLIDAFEKLKRSDVELWISGKGSLAETVVRAAESNSNIIFLGCLPYEEYLKKMLEVDIFVNPRDMNFLENKYNFPSKIMEYIATGRYVLSTRFAGWKKFEQYIDFCDSTVDDLYNKIMQCLDSFSYMKSGLHDRNREFARSFLWEEQVKKLNAVVVKDDE